MGQEIVYCHRCQTRLTGGDFERGRAFRINNNSTCAECAKPFLAALDDAQRAAFLERQRRPTDVRKGSTARMSAPRSLDLPASRPPPITSRHLPPPRKSSAAPWVIGLVCVAAGAALVVMLFAGGSGDRTREASEKGRERNVKKERTPPKPRTDRPPSGTPDPRETEARRAWEAAVAFATSNPKDLEGQVREYGDAMMKADRTSLYADAKRAFDLAKQSLARAIASELDDLGKAVRADADAKRFAHASDAIEGVREKYRSPEWTSGLYTVRQELLGKARRNVDLLQTVKKESLESVLAKVRTWKLPELVTEVRETMERAEAEPPEPPKPAVPPAVAAYRKTWIAAAGQASRLDFDGAVKTLSGAPASHAAVKKEAEADLTALRRAAELYAAGLERLRSWPRGRNLSVDFLEPGGRIRTIDEPVRRSDAFRATVRDGEADAVVPFGEILAGSVAALALEPGAPDADRAAVALLDLLDGGREPGKQATEKQLEHVDALAARRLSESEAEARRLLHEAERERRTHGGLFAAMRKAKTLLADHAESGVVRRNGAALRDLSEVEFTDFFFAPADLRPSGAFRAARHPKGPVSWTCSHDLEGLGDTSVDIVFSGPAGGGYRCWIYAGACCEETFEFFRQGTGMQDAPLDGEQAERVEHSIRFLKEFHVNHGGPKTPEKWGWIEIPLPEYAEAGSRTVRVLTAEQGFSVGYAVVSTARSSPPSVTEAEREASRRPSLPADALSAPPVARGSILLEIWEGIGGDRVSDFRNDPKFKGQPPTRSRKVDSAQGSRSWNDSYGSRMRGYVHPPATGDYVFWINTDDNGILYLSTDASPENKKKIAHADGATGYDDWEDSAPRKSDPVRLERGRRYYLEAWQKEGGGDDHLRVGWQLPDGKKERPIPGHRLSPFDPEATVRTGVRIVTPEPGLEAAEGKPVTFTGKISGPIDPYRITLFRGSGSLTYLREKSLEYTWRRPAIGTWPFFLQVSERGDMHHVSPPVWIKVGDLHFYRGVNLNGGPVTIDDQPWDGRDAPALAVRGMGYEHAHLKLGLRPDPDRGRMIRSSIVADEGTRVSLISVPEGRYLVALYTWAPADAAAFSLSLNGENVETNVKSEGGEWKRLGPWDLQVTRGEIAVEATRGRVHFSGIEAWRFGGPAPPPFEPKTPEESARVGGGGGSDFTEAPKDRPFLVGLRVSYSQHQGRKICKSIQPVFMKDGKVRDGKWHGNPTGTRDTVMAPEGYAIGAVIAKGSDRVDALKAVFMRISGPALFPHDARESKWLGGKGGGEEIRLGGTRGEPIVGLHGRQGGDTDAFGVIYLK